MHVTLFGIAGVNSQMRQWADAINGTDGHTSGMASLDISGGPVRGRYDWDGICGWDDVKQPRQRQEHRHRAEGVAGYVEHCVAEGKPDAGVVWGNATTAQRAAVAALRGAGVPVVFAELGWFRRPPDGTLRTNLFDCKGFRDEPTELSQEWWDRRLTADEDERLAKYIDWWKRAKSSKHGQKDNPLPSAIAEDKRPVLLVLLQCDHDSACWYSDGITTQEETLKAVRYAAQESWQVVVKEHPAGTVHAERSTNEVWLRDVNLHDCLQAADCVITGNSNAGLEALLYEKPVVSLADAPYGQLGFTFDVRDKDTLRVVLRRVGNGLHGPHLGNRFLRAFLHYVIFEYCFAPDEAEALLAKLQKRLGIG